MLKKYLYPGEIYLGRQATEVTTVLGSCVAVCLFDPSLNIGAINHFMLPEYKEEKDTPTKYGNTATKEIIRFFLDNGSKTTSLQAKVFGGASTLNDHFSIGAKNIQTALDILKEHKIRILNSSLGGNLARKIVFETGKGSVYMKFIEGLSI